MLQLAGSVWRSLLLLPPLPPLTPGQYLIFRYLQYYWSAKSRDGDRRRETLGSQNQSPDKVQLEETSPEEPQGCCLDRQNPP